MFEPCCRKSNYTMSKTQNVILRLTIVLGMIAAVVAVLYFSPLPEGHFESCDRPCHDLDWPKICRIKIHIEAAHNLRDPNQTLSQGITVNRQAPGPPILLCQNDILVVDVINKIGGHALTVHWRGQPNYEAPYMDGVPLVTQCPIHSYSTFQYKFRVTSPGTHLYHAYSDKDRSLGMFGALIVRQPEKIDPLRKHYDIDSPSHLLLISERDNQLLINGKRAADAGGGLLIFNVKRNKRYRFRVASVSGDCPTTLTIDNHPIKIICLDGNPVHPLEVSSFVIGAGERLDFVVKTNQNVTGHFLRLKSCKGDGLALLKYEEGASIPKPGNKPTEQTGRSFDTAFCESNIGRVCLKDVKSLTQFPDALKEASAVVYLSFDSRIANVNGKFSSRVFGVNNLTFTYPSSPLLTQLDKIPSDIVCDELNIPEECQGREICECVHVQNIPLGSSAEIILVNQDASDEEHIFHLHGYRFYLVGFRQFDTSPRIDEIKLLDRQNVLFVRNLNNPVLKDTIRIPRNGVVALRFLANNPGFWMLRDEKSGGWTRGMDLVIQVGDSGDLPSTPSDFPKCGNYIGPDFFLM